MKKAERDAVAMLIARWEWQQNGSSSNAAARAACARDLQTYLGLTDDDLQFWRVFEIAEQAGIADDDAAFDRLCDLADSIGYTALVDRIETVGLDGVRGLL